ncbi:gephyrin-like molybdotransferase receptor GlpR [Streptomyces sp. S4.7]|uniref:divisome protein SepX/GlpR n=1 Tax=Streptomyces sp. S4.7 TaxID=2705439 RepID=UPI0013DCB825|nr:gephyrin-like molybdotransferase receptor GlpR [Streptomyces sp. S4.7]
MSSSGLIYAVIVGAWAAYLVPMWLRRQDELNEARPTERFSTAIRLLSGRAGMERRYAKELQDRTTEEAGPDDGPDAAAEPTSSVDVRSFSAPAARTEARLEIPAPSKRPAPAPAAASDPAHAPTPAPARPAPERRPRPSGAAAERARRAQRSQVLARRRRTTVVLFLAFTIGAVVAGVQGLAFLWAPGVPAILLSVYIVHLRAQERRRFVFTMDRRRAEIAAQRLRENRPRRHHQVSAPAEPDEEPEPRPAPEPAPSVSPQEAGRRALVEQTDHAEWVDQQRERGPARGDSWEPVPVPLPTYVTAPVAPRASSGVNVSDPETWSAARSSTAEPAPAEPAAPEPPAPRHTPPLQRRSRTPLFDQYDDGDRPRAANE